eukprot:GHVR01033382.1.p1 GENE.GHVR01033382.1~~GHVR01033382.1.p1  ORF type:complete len:101 (-),score=16.31 GHVR01033382.1:85-387(-)
MQGKGEWQVDRQLRSTWHMCVFTILASHQMERSRVQTSARSYDELHIGTASVWKKAHPTKQGLKQLTLRGIHLDGVGVSKLRPVDQHAGPSSSVSAREAN